MTEERPKLKRKRRRWIVAGVLLFVVSFTVWWHWPRGDARFVGSWTVPTPSGGPPAVMTLRANGMASTVVPGLVHSTFPWRVSGNRLHFGWRCSGFALPAASRLASGWFALTGTLPAVGEQSVELTDISDESISYRRPAVAGPAPTPAEEVITMTRVPE
jgi:hypothetical protein